MKDDCQCISQVSVSYEFMHCQLKDFLASFKLKIIAYAEFNWTNTGEIMRDNDLNDESDE